MVDASGAVETILSGYRQVLLRYQSDVTGDPAALRAAATRHTAQAGSVRAAADAIGTRARTLGADWEAPEYTEFTNKATNLSTTMTTGTEQVLRQTASRLNGAANSLTDARTHIDTEITRFNGQARVLVTAARSIPDNQVDALLTNARNLGSEASRKAQQIALDLSAALGYRLLNVSAGTSISPNGPMPTPRPGWQPPRPIVPPATPGEFRIPGGPTIPSDIVPNGPRPVVTVPEPPSAIPWRLAGRFGGLTTALGVLLIPDNEMPMFDYVDPLGNQHRLTEDQMSAVHNRLPGFERHLGYPEGTVVPREAPPDRPVVPLDAPGQPTDPVIEPRDDTRVVEPPDQPVAPVEDPAWRSPVPLEATGSLLPEYVYEPGRERQLTPEEREQVMRELNNGRLSENTAAWLRAEARRMWRDATAGMPDYASLQPGRDFHVHHIRELHWAHLYPEQYPNADSNLALWNSRAHESWNGQLRLVEPDMMNALERQGITGDAARRIVADHVTGNFVPTDPGVYPLTRVPARR
jgi:hypothetical protein